LQDELTIEESILHQIMKLLKSLKLYESAENPEDGSLPKALTEWINTMLGILTTQVNPFQTKA
jgi:hypothetical protein